MTQPRLGRRAAMLLPLAAPMALSGCGLFNNIFETPPKPKLPGLRESVMASNHGLVVAAGAPPVVLPPIAANAGWPQAGGNPSHLMGQLQAASGLQPAWVVKIGAGGGYRRKIMAQPIVARGIVYTMDSNAVVRAFRLADGRPLWKFDTREGDEDSTNVGGGLGVDSGTLYAVNGLAATTALDAATGKMKWKLHLPAPTRSAPTIADGRLFVTTIDDKLYALAADDGRTLWTHQAASASTTLLGQPAPAYSAGIVIAGFGSGELAALRGDGGDVAWTDSLASVQGNAVADLSAVRGLPVVAGGRVYAVGIGGLMLALDLRSGRRLWELDVAGEDSICCAGDWLFVVSIDQRIAAVSRLDGSVAWVAQLPRWKNEKKSTGAIYWYGPALVSGRLIVAGTNKEALAISPYTGEVLGRQKLTAPGSFGPTVADGTVFIVTDDGKLTAYR